MGFYFAHFCSKRLPKSKMKFWIKAFIRFRWEHKYLRISRYEHLAACIFLASIFKTSSWITPGTSIMATRSTFSHVSLFYSILSYFLSLYLSFFIIFCSFLTFIPCYKGALSFHFWLNVATAKLFRSHNDKCVRIQMECKMKQKRIICKS